jgi:hypothetical protein
VGTEPDALHLLLPVEQWEPRVLFAQEHWFAWSFRVKVASHMGGWGAWSSEFLCVQEVGLTTKENQVMEPGATGLQGQGIHSVELQVILPILPVVSCFSICK